MSEQQKIDVRVSDVLTFLKEGKTREDIANHYGLSLAEAKRDIFSHPKLKNKKTHKASKVALIDDTPEVQITDDTNTQESVLATADLQSEQQVFEAPVADTTATEEAQVPAPQEENTSNEEGQPATQAGTW